LSLSPVVSAHGTAPDPQTEQTAPAARVALDPASGKQRPVEYDDGIDAGAASTSRGPAQGQAALRQIYSRTGARGVALDESFMSYTVVRRNPQGGLDSACVQGESAAHSLLEPAPVARSVKSGGAYETE